MYFKLTNKDDSVSYLLGTGNTVKNTRLLSWTHLSLFVIYSWNVLCSEPACSLSSASEGTLLHTTSLLLWGNSLPLPLTYPLFFDDTPLTPFYSSFLHSPKNPARLLTHTPSSTHQLIPHLLNLHLGLDSLPLPCPLPPLHSFWVDERSKCRVSSSLTLWPLGNNTYSWLKQHFLFFLEIINVLMWQLSFPTHPPEVSLPVPRVLGQWVLRINNIVFLLLWKMVYSQLSLSLYILTF